MRFLRSLPFFLLSLSLSLSLMLCAGCGGRSGTSNSAASGGDSGPKPVPVKDTGPAGGDLAPERDHAQPGKDAAPKGPLGCTNDCHDYVISALRMPLNTVEAEKYAYEHNGKKYNALGQIVLLIVAQGLPKGYSQPLMEGICSGQALNLLRVRAASLSQAAQAKVQSWTADQKCCTGASCYDDKADKCTAAATATCFGGKGKFAPHPDKVTRVHPGKISASRLMVQGDRMSVRLLVDGVSAPLVIDLRSPQIRGTINGSTIEGTLAGLVPESYVEQSLLPWLAKVIGDLLASPHLDANTRKLLLSLFDTNKDGKVTADELANNPLLKTFLKGSDLDGDGEADVSLGVGMSAVKAVIGAP